MNHHSGEPRRVPGPPHARTTGGRHASRRPRPAGGPPRRRTEVLAGGTIGLLVVGAVVLLGALDPAPVPVPAESTAAPQVVPAAALDAVNCAKGADTLGQVGQAIEEAGGIRGPAVLTALDSADARMARRLGTPDPRLAAVFAETRAGLQDLRTAVRAGQGVGNAADELILLVDTLDARCREILGPQG